MAMRKVTPAETRAARADALERPREQWWLYRRELSDGRVIYLVPRGHGNALGISPNASARYYDDEWQYPYDETEGGWAEALGWDGVGEPEGWYRHPSTGRRRPGGDASLEFVRE